MREEERIERKRQITGLSRRLILVSGFLEQGPRRLPFFYCWVVAVFLVVAVLVLDAPALVMSAVFGAALAVAVLWI